MREKDYTTLRYKGGKVKLFSPKDYLKHEPIEPKVLPLVMELNSRGFITRASCQGHRGYIDRDGTPSRGFVVFLEDSPLSYEEKLVILEIARDMNLPHPLMKTSEAGLPMLEFNPL